jgi:hypothetical protein
VLMCYIFSRWNKKCPTSFGFYGENLLT